MSLALYDRVRETTTVLGTNDAVLLGAVTGYQSFAVVGNTNTCYYTIADNLGNWEVGLGTYSTTGPTLARTTVYSSSNSNLKVNFPAGTKDIFLTYPSEKAVALDTASSIASGSLLYGNGTTSFTSLPVGSSGQVLTSTGSAPQWAALSGVSVTTFSAGTTGFTPSSATSGAITLGGTLATTNGGTGLTSFSADQVFYASSTSAVGQSANMTFNGTSLTLANVLNAPSVNGATTLALSTGGTNAMTISSGQLVTFPTTGAVTLPVGTSGQQPGTPTVGMIRYNTTTNSFEGYAGSTPAWGSIGGGGAPTTTDFTATGGQTVFTISYTVGNLEVYRNGIKLGIGDFTASNGTSVTLATGCVAGDLVEFVQFTGSPSASGVTSISTGAGITASGSTGNVTLSLTPVGANQVVYGNGSGVYSSSANMTFNGTALTLANDATIHGVTVGLGGGASSTNTVVGNSSGGSNTGVNNAFFGWQAGNSNTSGSANSYFGQAAGYSNGGGTGSNNCGFGEGALFGIGSGSSNVAVGHQALLTNASGSYNIGIGEYALYYNTASNNTAVGYQAGYSNTTGTNNIYVGNTAGYSNQTASYNTFVGDRAGYSANYSGVSANTFIGNYTGYSVTSGIGNTFVGSGITYAAGTAMTTGSNNTILGAFPGNLSGLDIRTANNYIVLSDGAGNPRLTCDGSGNSFFGPYNSNPNAANYGVRINGIDGNNFWISSTSTTAAYDQFKFYTAAGQAGLITTTGTTTAYNTSSDYRLKEDVQPMQDALAKVAQLNPVTYKWKFDGSDGQGFIAHELQAVVPDCVTGEKDGVDEEGNPKYQAIDTSFLVATLTKAIQELNTLVTTQAAEIEALKAKVGI